MANLNQPPPGGVLFETADGKLSWRPRQKGSMSKSNLHIIQEAWAIPDGDGANLTTRQLLLLIYLPIVQRKKRAGKVYNSCGRFKIKYAYLTTVSDQLLQEVGLERHQVPRLGSAGLKKRNKAHRKEAEWFGMPANDEMAAGTSSVEEGYSTFSTDCNGYFQNSPPQHQLSSHDPMYPGQENWIHEGYQLPHQQMHQGQGPEEHWFHNGDNAKTGYQLPPQQADPIHTPTHDNPIYAQYIGLLQSGAIPAGYQESDSYQLPPEPLGPITPDNPIYAQYISPVQSGEYQIFDQRTGLLQQPLPENIYNPNAVLIPTPSDSTLPSNQAPILCYPSPTELCPENTGVIQAPPRHYTSPYDPLPLDTRINRSDVTPPSTSMNDVSDLVAVQTPEIRDREKVQRPRRRRYTRTFAAQMGWFDTPSASP